MKAERDCDICDLNWKQHNTLRCTDCVIMYGRLPMICETCHGSRYIWIEDAFSTSLRPCPRCGGQAIESCCDGEDRWQQEKRDDQKKPEDKPR